MIEESLVIIQVTMTLPALGLLWRLGTRLVDAIWPPPVARITLINKTSTPWRMAEGRDDAESYE